jgi:hypothetical protein
MKKGGTYPASRGAASFVLWVFPLLFLAASVFMSSMAYRERSSPRHAGNRPGGRESLLLEMSRYPGLSFGFRNLLADLQWLEAVQVAGSRRLSGTDYDRLDVLVRTVNNFDPKFVVPYLLGGLVLGDSSRHIPEALKTFERGGRNFPGDWRFPFYIGYIQYFSLGNPADGGRAIEAAARIPGSPPHFPFLAARMFSEGRKPETALVFLEEMLKQEADPARRVVLQRRILEVIVERDIQGLERAVEAFRSRSGELPGDLHELVPAGFLREVPAEPHGGRYLLNPDGTVRSDHVMRRLRVFRKR